MNEFHEPSQQGAGAPEDVPGNSTQWTRDPIGPAVQFDPTENGTDLLQRLLEAAHVGWWYWDVAPNRVLWSASLASLMGTTAEAFGGTYEGFLASCVHPDDRRKLNDVILRAMANKRDGEAELRALRPNGTVRWHLTRTHVLCDATGRVSRILGLVVDITERKKVEDALRQSEDRFQAFMDNGPAVAYMKDEAGRYVYVSRTARRYVGTDPAEQIGKTDDELWTCTGTFGNGAVIGMRRTPSRPRRIPRDQKQARAECAGAAVGGTQPVAAGLRIAEV